MFHSQSELCISLKEMRGMFILIYSITFFFLVSNHFDLFNKKYHDTNAPRHQGMFILNFFQKDSGVAFRGL